MAIINCPECGKEISNNSRSCPHCGMPIKTNKKLMIASIITIAVLVIAGILLWTNSKNDLDDIEQSVVTIYCYDSNDELVATGSGFIMFDSKTLVTNFHVLELAYKMAIETESGAYYNATDVLNASEENDIAILSIEDNTWLKPLQASTDEVTKGDKVTAIGSPLGIQNTISDGLVSGLRTDIMDGVEVIQTSAPISEGSSGGVLLNEGNQVIGVTYSGIEDGQNINFAIPISVVVSLYENGNYEKTPVSEFYKANITSSDLDHNCSLDKMELLEVIDIETAGINAESYAENGNRIFIYGYFSSMNQNYMYWYSDPSLATGDFLIDDENYYVSGGIPGNNSNILRINLKYAYYHSSKSMTPEIGDLMIVNTLLFIKGSNSTSFDGYSGYSGTYFQTNPSELADIADMGGYEILNSK